MTGLDPAISEPQEDVGPAPAISETAEPPDRSSGRDWRTLVAVAIVGVAFVLPLRALFRYQGPPMEEGFMLVFPERVLRGALPNRDFLHLYGPGSLWALAGWFKAFGVSLASERFFGMLQLLGIIFGVFVLALPWGRKVATAAGLIGVLISLTAIGLTALAWDGAVALGLAGLILGLQARRRIAEPPTTAPADDRARALAASRVGTAGRVGTAVPARSHSRHRPGVRRRALGPWPSRGCGPLRSGSEPGCCRI